MQGAARQSGSRSSEERVDNILLGAGCERGAIESVDFGFPRFAEYLRHLSSVWVIIEFKL